MAAAAITVDQLADAIRASLTRLVTTGQRRRIAVALYQLLADGGPVATGAVAALSGTDAPTVERPRCLPAIHRLVNR
jgi:hypothetical protein